VKRNLSKISAAGNKEMLLALYAQWQKSHPEIVAKYPSIDPTWGWRRIDKITAQIGREILNATQSDCDHPFRVTGEACVNCGEYEVKQ
jgi:hypothetical protein